MDSKKAKNIANKIIDIIEVYLPSVCFIVLFVSYIILIVYRYLLKSSIQWLNELSWISYLWAATLALSYGGRKGNDVMFTLVYDKCNKNVQKVFRIIGNGLIVILFTVALPHVIGNINFMSIKKTSIMRIPYNFLYSPFILFVVLSDLYCLIRLVKDIASLFVMEKAEKEGNEK